LLNNTISAATKTSYSSGYKIFTRFAVMSGYNLHSDYLPSRLILRCIAYCHGIRNIQYGTIRSYLAAIRFYRLHQGFPDPFRDMNGSYIPQIEMALRGSRRLNISPTKQCKPITTDLLHKLIVNLRAGVFNPYVDILMQAALTAAFWGFFRSGELFPDKFSPQMHITNANVKFDDSIIIIHLKTSKTDLEKKGVDVRLFKNGTLICAVYALTNFARLRTNNQDDSPFFLLPNGQPLTRRVFVANLRHLLLRLGIQASSYSGHSMRVGAATSAAASGVPDHLIQVLGRWTSLSYLRYIRVSNNVIRQAHHKMLRFSL